MNPRNLTPVDLVDYVTGRAAGDTRKNLDEAYGHHQEIAGEIEEWRSLLHDLGRESDEAERVAEKCKRKIRDDWDKHFGMERTTGSPQWYVIAAAASLVLGLASILYFGLTGNAAFVDRPLSDQGFVADTQTDGGTLGMAHVPLRSGPAGGGRSMDQSQLSWDGHLIYVHFGHAGKSEGSLQLPYTSLSDAIAQANQGDTVVLNGQVSAEFLKIDKRIRVMAADGPVRIGAAS